MAAADKIDFNNCGHGRPVVVGIYGLPGAGKSFALAELRQMHGDEYIVVDGSQVIARLVLGGLEAFQGLDENQKCAVREHALQTIGADCLNDGKAAVVAGHFLLWSSSESRPVSVWTRQDLKTYTHMVYLKTRPEVVQERRLNAVTESRTDLSTEQLRQWQHEEERQLRHACYESGIIYHVLEEEDGMVATKLTELLAWFLHRRQEDHIQQGEAVLDDMVAASAAPLVSALVLDADKTLSPADSGHLFWEHVHQNDTVLAKENHLEKIFGGPLGYTSAAFLQTALLYQAAWDQGVFDQTCQEVARQISLYPDMLSFLYNLRSNENCAVVVVTCGLRLVWERVLERYGLHHTITVLGGGPLGDDHCQVITASMKARLVRRLQQQHHLHVVAMGDSVLDLDMLAQAHRAVVVVGDARNRSRRMEKELDQAIIQAHRFSAHQAILDRGAPPRLSTSSLPLVQLGDPTFCNWVLPSYAMASVNMIHFTDTRTSKILSTEMRDAANRGPSLRKVHACAGQYLAFQTLPDLLGVEEFPIQHVQGHKTPGTRIAQQEQTLIVALMRGGEPMAVGVNDILPSAPLLHAHTPNDIQAKHVEAMKTVILVDAVVNSGATVVNFVQRVRSLDLDGTLRLVVLCGVMQTEAELKFECLASKVHDRPINLVALRLSENKFTGQGGTDTGNRLFNTTRLA